jgi:hypothetical protein
MARLAYLLVTFSLAFTACSAPVSNDPGTNQSRTTSGSPSTSVAATSTCGAATTDAVATTTAPPIIVTTLAPGEDYLNDRSTITQDDSGSQFTTALGNRIELHLNNCWLWSAPLVTGSAQLVGIDYVTDPGFVAWEILIEGTGVITITSIGTDTGSDDSESPDLRFGVQIDVGSD